MLNFPISKQIIPSNNDNSKLQYFDTLFYSSEEHFIFDNYGRALVFITNNIIIL